MLVYFRVLFKPNYGGVQMIGIYIRVSTHGQNVAGQRAEIQRWLVGQGIKEESVLWFVDKSSGDNFDRASFARLQERVFRGDIKTIVVWKLDRLSRNMIEGLNVLADWCDRGMRVVSVTQQIDFNGAMGKMLAAVLLGVAEMEQETRRERQAAGIAAAKERGVYTGRQKGAVKAGVDPAKAVSLRQRGWTQEEIAKSLGVSVSSVRRYLKAA